MMAKAKVNAKILRVKTPDELKDNLTALKKEQFNLRFQKATGQLENVARERLVRRDISRILMVLREKRGDQPAI